MFKFLKRVFSKRPGIVLSHEDFERLICGLNSVSSKLEVLYNNKLSSDLEKEDIFRSCAKRIQDYTTMSADDIGKEGESEKVIHEYKQNKLLDDIVYNNRRVNVKRVCGEGKREDIYWVHINYFLELSEEYEELNKCIERDYGLLPDFTISLNDVVKQFRIISSIPRSCDDINCNLDYIEKIYDKLAVGNEMLRECLEWNKKNNSKLNVNLIRRGGAFAAEMGN